MKYQQLNTNWNADPNCPEPIISIDGSRLRITFYLNSFLFDNIQEGEKGELIFNNCCKFNLNECNDEGYFMGQYRYGNKELPWGEFYKIESNWEKDFCEEFTLLDNQRDKKKMKHYIFFFRDNIFECIAEDFKFIMKKK